MCLHPCTLPTPPSRSLSRNVTTQQVDTNILNVDMAALGNAAPVATGDPIFCSGCRACLSVVSILRPAGTETNGDDQSQPAVASGPGTAAPCLGVLTEETPTDLSSSVMRLGASGEHECTPATGHHGATEVEEGVYDWTCEFCGTENSGIELDCMEKPVEGQESVDFVLEPAPASVAAAAARMSNEMGGGANHVSGAKVRFCFVLFIGGGGMRRYWYRAHEYVGNTRWRSWSSDTKPHTHSDAFSTCRCCTEISHRE